MADLCGIFNIIREDTYLFWLMLILAVLSLRSLMDEHDSLAYTLPRYLNSQYDPYSYSSGCYSGYVPVEEIYEPVRAGIGIGGALSSHSGAIVPRQYTAQRNCLIGANI